MAKYLVIASAIWVDSPGCTMRQRRKAKGDIVELKASDAKQYLNAGQVESIKKHDDEPEPAPELNLE